MNQFTVKVDLHKKISALSCYKCSVIADVENSENGSFTVTCPQCQAIKIHEGKKTNEGIKYPLKWLFT